MNLQKLTGKNAIKWTCIMDPSGIQLPGHTWNPTGGCQHDCRWTMPDGSIAHCYAEDVAHGIAKNAYPQGFKHHYFHEKRLLEPASLKKPSGIFLDSMSDLMGHWVPDDQVEQVLEIVKLADWHIFQLLTKNAPHLLKFDFPANVWIGVSSPPDHMWGRALTDHQKRRMLARSLDVLAKIEDRVRWMSFEPLSWNVADIVKAIPGALDWAVIGAASNGNTKYPPAESHLRGLLRVLDDQNVPVYFKGNLRSLDYANKNWREDFPAGGDPIFSDMAVTTPFGHTGTTQHLTEHGWQVTIDTGDKRIYPSYNLTPRPAPDPAKIIDIVDRVPQPELVGAQLDAPTTYSYLGDRLTDPSLKNMPYDPVRREDGKCIVGQGTATKLIEDQEGDEHVVLCRRLRLTTAEKAHRQFEKDIKAARKEWPTLTPSDFVIYEGDTIHCPDGKERKALAVSEDGYQVTVRTGKGRVQYRRIDVQVTDRQYHIPNIGDTIVWNVGEVVNIKPSGITVQYPQIKSWHTDLKITRPMQVTYSPQEYYLRTQSHREPSPQPPTLDEIKVSLALTVEQQERKKLADALTKLTADLEAVTQERDQLRDKNASALKRENAFLKAENAHLRVLLKREGGAKKESTPPASLATMSMFDTQPEAQPTP